MTGLDAAAINVFLAEAFPFEGRPAVEAAARDRVRCRLRFEARQIRPGGTVSGPAMMALADTAAYALLFAAVGLEPLAVTSNLTISFLRKPQPADLIAEATLLKLGRTLLVCAVEIRSEGAAEPCAHATVTYARAPRAVSDA